MSFNLRNHLTRDLLLCVGSASNFKTGWLLHFAVLHSFENKIACCLKSFASLLLLFFFSFISFDFFRFLSFFDFRFLGQLALEIEESESSESSSVVVVVFDLKDDELELLLDDELEESGGLGGGGVAAIIGDGLFGFVSILLSIHSLKLSSSFGGDFELS